MTAAAASIVAMPDARTPSRRFSLLDSLGETANHRNALLLVQLRWLAVLGQALTIGLSAVLFDLRLPFAPMFFIVGLLVLFNLYAMLRPRPGGQVGDGELMAELFVDISALTALLYLSGGATNPFVFLYLLPVTLGAILLERRSRWALAAYAMLCFGFLTRTHLPLDYASADRDAVFRWHLYGLFACFALDLLLLVFFMERIGANVRRRDRHLADLRQQASEEDHIVRMGLLASGAAHELGTPLATLSVLIGDWKRLPAFADDLMLREELDEAATELKRIKGIVSGILMSAGAARGGRVQRTTLAAFFEATLAEWRAQWPATVLEVSLEKPLDERAWRQQPVISDSAFRQVLFNVLDNAREVSPAWVGVALRCRDGEVAVTVRDHGPGFAPEILMRIGRPYQSTKGKPGGGLGLFLVVNVLRRFGGRVEVENGEAGGAAVRMSLPLPSVIPNPESMP